MRALGRWLLRALLALALVILALLAPVAYVETACRGTPLADAYAPILPLEHRRPESRTLLTYPEWHIVHAYDDYAEVIRAGDPHDFRTLTSIGGFWSSLCALSQTAAAHGGIGWETRQMVYVVGVSFTVELLLKAAYEETLGRAATWVKGPAHAPLDALSARQAADYATFLQQVPWYRWDFAADAAALDAAATPAFRDSERALALGLEYGAKAAYAKIIAAAVAGVGPDALTMRSIVTGLPPEALAGVDGVTVVAERPQGVEIETPRYRAFTDIARVLAGRGAAFVEIAGNDDIMLTAITEGARDLGALHRFERQGNPGYRHLLLVPVASLAGALRDPGLAVEHVQDY